jgi:hypothetical protein
MEVALSLDLLQIKAFLRVQLTIIHKRVNLCLHGLPNEQSLIGSDCLNLVEKRICLLQNKAL